MTENIVPYVTKDQDNQAEPQDMPISSIEHSPEINKILPAMIEARKLIPEFTADTEGQSGHQKYPYAPLPLVLKTVIPHLLEQDLLLIQAPAVLGDQVYLDTKIYHTSGQWFGCSMHAGVDHSVGGQGGSFKALGSAVSYLRRYPILALLGIAADRDDDGTAAGATSRTNGGGGQDPRKRPPQAASASSAAKPLPTRSPGGPPAGAQQDPLAPTDRKRVDDMKNEVTLLAAGDEQRHRQIVMRITRFKKRQPKPGEPPWFSGYASLDSIRNSTMVRMAQHNLGELINNDITLDDPMDDKATS